MYSISEDRLKQKGLASVRKPKLPKLPYFGKKKIKKNLYKNKKKKKNIRAAASFILSGTGDNTDDESSQDTQCDLKNNPGFGKMLSCVFSTVKNVFHDVSKGDTDQVLTKNSRSLYLITFVIFVLIVILVIYALVISMKKEKHIMQHHHEHEHEMGMHHLGHHEHEHLFHPHHGIEGGLGTNHHQHLNPTMEEGRETININIDGNGGMGDRI